MKKTILLALTLFITLSSQADPGPFGRICKGYFSSHNNHFTVFQFGIIPGIQLYDSDWIPVYGMSIGTVWIYSTTRMYGLRFSPFSYQEKSYALALSMWDVTDHNYGPVLALCSSQSKNYGMATSLYNRPQENYGLSCAMVNDLRISNSGVLLGLVNIAQGQYTREQPSKSSPQIPHLIKSPPQTPKPIKNNVQLGLINIANHGWQFGIMNYNKDSVVSYMVFCNYSNDSDTIDK